MSRQEFVKVCFAWELLRAHENHVLQKMRDTLQVFHCCLNPVAMSRGECCYKPSVDTPSKKYPELSVVEAARGSM